MIDISKVTDDFTLNFFYQSVLQQSSFNRDDASEYIGLIHDKHMYQSITDPIANEVLTYIMANLTFKPSRSFVDGLPYYSNYQPYTDSDHNGAVVLYTSNYSSSITTQRDQQYIEFTEQPTSVNTLYQPRRRMTDEDKHISSIIIKTLRKMHRNHKSKQNLTLINYLVKELELNNKE